MSVSVGASGNLWFGTPKSAGSNTFPTRAEQSHLPQRSSSDGWQAFSSPATVLKPKVIRLKSRQGSMDEEDFSAPIWSGPENRVCLAALPEKLASQNPYIGYFHRGHRANYPDIPETIAGDLAQPMKRRKGLSKSCKGLCKSSSAESLEMLEKEAISATQSQWISASMDVEEVEVEEEEHKSLMKKALQLQNHVPTSPELCGFQAMLPRQSGVQVLEKIGEGSFGKVVLANNKRNKSQWDKAFLSSRQLFDMPAEGENLVLKCVRKQSFGTGGAAFDGELVHREVRLHSRCNHPNIVKIYGFYEQEDRITLILGFAEGRELHMVLQEQRRLEEAEAVPIFLQVLRAVDFMHGQQIIHRDLKPRNILLSKNGKVTVIDLGLALDLGDEKDREASQNQELVGTLGYLPPELQIGKSRVGLPMDMWALGVILYEMLFGFSPFLPHEVALPSSVEFPDQSWGMIISECLQNLIEQLLHKDPSQRINTTGALQHPIWISEVVERVDSVVANSVSERISSGEQDEVEDEEDRDWNSGFGVRDFSDNLAIKVNKDLVGELEWGGQYFYEYYLAVVADADGSIGSGGSEPEF